MTSIWDPERIHKRVKIGKSGRITFPAVFRRYLGVELGDYVDVVEHGNGRITIQAATDLSDDDNSDDNIRMR